MDVVFWNVIKGLIFRDLPTNIVITVDNINYDETPPLNLIPYPFTSVSFIKDEKGFFVLYEATAFRYNSNLHKKDRWQKKWTIDFYFRELLSYSIPGEVEVIIRESVDDIAADLEVKICIEIPKSLEDALLESTAHLETILNQAEIGLKGFSDILELSKLWKNRNEIKAEKSWQKILKANSWILSLAFSQPMLLFEDEGFIGGKSIGNDKGKIVDFVYRNRLTTNVFLIEIKTPRTKIIGAKYRDTYSLSKELTGGINQTLSYINSLNKDYYSIKANTTYDFDFVGAKGLLVIGSLDELNIDQKRTFEIFRSSVSGIEIITFDELFEKIFMILAMMKDN